MAGGDGDIVSIVPGKLCENGIEGAEEQGCRGKKGV